MTETPNLWLITGAGRGLGVDIAKAALEAGHEVVATARRGEAITEALGEHDALLPVARMSPIRPLPTQPSGQRPTASADSTYSSTMPGVSTPDSSRR